MWADVDQLQDAGPVTVTGAAVGLPDAGFQSRLEMKKQLSTAARNSRVTPLKRRRVAIADADDIVVGKRSDSDPQKARIDHIQARRQLARIEHVDACFQSARMSCVDFQRAVQEGLDELSEQQLEAERAIQEAHDEAEAEYEVVYN